MPITYPLVHPATPGFRSIRLSPQNAVAVTESPYSFATQVQAHQGQRLIADVTLPPIKQDSTADEWAAWLTALRGRYGTFLLGDSSRKAIRGTGLYNSGPFVYGASQSGGVLTTNGWVANSPGVLLRGDYIQVGRTNFALYSSEFDNAAWAKGGLSVSPNAVTAPVGGTTSADQITTNSSSTNPGIAQYLGSLFNPGESYTFSVFLKTSSGSIPTTLYFYRGAANQYEVKNITITSSWQRFYITARALGYSCGIGIGGFDTLAGASKVFYAWGAQVERGIAAGPYTPTSGSIINEKLRMHKVISDASSNETGIANIEIFPLLRESPVDGGAINLVSPRGTFRMAEEPSWDVDEAKLYGISFRAVEDI